MICSRKVQYVIVVILLHLSPTRTTLLGPVGILLCKQMCLNTIACETYTYIPDHLKCFKGNIPSTLKGRRVTRRLKKPTPNYQLKCETGSRILTSKRTQQVCFKENGTPEENDVLTIDQLPRLRQNGYRGFTEGQIMYLYKLYGNKISWENATKQCKKDGGLLAQFKQDFKWKLVPQSGVLSENLFADLSWIGLSDQQRNDKYVWLDGTEPKQDRWYHGFPFSEPSHKRLGLDQNCGAMKYKAGTSVIVLYDCACSQPNTFLCEVLVEHN